MSFRTFLSPKSSQKESLVRLERNRYFGAGRLKWVWQLPDNWGMEIKSDSSLSQFLLPHNTETAEGQIEPVPRPINLDHVEGSEGGHQLS